MKAILYFLLFLFYFEAAVGTMVFYHDDVRVCSAEDRPRKCLVDSAATGAAWPFYWSVIAWRGYLNEQPEP